MAEPVFPGLHIEGPWINKEKRGAHIESFIHAPQKMKLKNSWNMVKLL